MTIIVLYFTVTMIVPRCLSAGTVTSLEHVKKVTSEGSWLVKSFFTLKSLLILMGNTSCLVTMSYLQHYKYKKKVKADTRADAQEMQKKDKEKKAVITLFLMNVPFCFQMGVSAAYVYYLFAEKFFYQQYNLLRELYFVGTPIFVAFSNPVVLVIRNTDYRNKITDLIKSRLF